MARKHAILVTLVLALAAVLGAVALGHTLGLGAAANKANDALVAKRTQQLDRFEASLRRQLGQKAVALPAIPQAPTASTKAPQRVVYVRPKPIVIHKHRAGGEYEAEGADHGGGFDD
jgi:hypothetical protein